MTAFGMTAFGTTRDSMMRALRWVIIGVVALALTVLSIGGAADEAQAAEDPSISIPSGSATAEVGRIIAVTIQADDLVDLHAYTLEFTYDPALVEFVNADDPPALDGFGEASVLPDGHSVRYLHTALGSSPTASGSAALVTMRFRLLGVGSTTIEFASAEFVDSTGESTSQSGIGVYSISVVPPAPTTGGLAATAPDAADTGSSDGSASNGSASDDGRSRGTATGSEGLAGTGASPLAGIVLTGVLLGAGCLLVLARTAAKMSARRRRRD